MRITLGRIRRLVQEAVKHDFAAAERRMKAQMDAVENIARRFPLLRKIRLALAYASWSRVRPGRQHDADGATVSPAEHARIHDFLVSDPEAASTWRIGPLQHDDSGPWFQAARMEEIRDAEKKQERQRASAARGAQASLDVRALDVLPATKFTKRQLYVAAESAGHELYDDSASSLIWDARSPSEAKLERTNTYRWARRYAGIVGEDALDYETFQPPDFSYVFFPSRPGAGLDVGEKAHFIRDRKKMADADGNIYLVDNISGTAISVIKPTLTTRQEYTAVVTKTLKAGA